jgi:hypothetical protein
MFEKQKIMNSKDHDIMMRVIAAEKLWEHPIWRAHEIMYPVTQDCKQNCRGNKFC